MHYIHFTFYTLSTTLAIVCYIYTIPILVLVDNMVDFSYDEVITPHILLGRL